MPSPVAWPPRSNGIRAELYARVGLDPLRGSSVSNLSRPAERAVTFYNKHAPAEQFGRLAAQLPERYAVFGPAQM